MKITIEREDLCTKKSLIKMMKLNYMRFNSSEFYRGWNEAIDQLIEVMERDL
jgi:hypothetical protein